MKKRVRIGIILTLLVFLLIMLFTKKYHISVQKSYIPYVGSADLYNASREELVEEDLCKYPGAFGPVNNAKEAYIIAEKVIKEVYGYDEYPYIVKYNKTANAWIVHGSLLLFSLGGSASIAIDKDTGEILMLLHTK